MNRPPRREDLYALFPRHGRGAELGVQLGKNALALINIAQPTRLHLIDLWPRGEPCSDGLEQVDGETCYQRVRELARTHAVIDLHRADTVTALESLPDGSLDWAYLDSSHGYAHTVRELQVLQRKVKPTGVIAGHDYHYHFPGVIQAVDEFVDATDWRLAHLTCEEFWPSFALMRKA